MEQDSPTKYLEAQIRESYGKVVYSHKTQEKCADIILARHEWVKIIQIGLSALTTTGVLIAVFGEDIRWVGIVTAVISSVLFAINTYTKGHDLGKISQKHSDAASDLWLIREKYLSILTDLQSDDVQIDTIRQQRDELVQELVGIYKGAPRTFSKAYNKAAEALQLNEELTFSDDEIDLLLPSELAKSRRETNEISVNQ